MISSLIGVGDWWELHFFVGKNNNRPALWLQHPCSEQRAVLWIRYEQSLVGLGVGRRMMSAKSGMLKMETAVICVTCRGWREGFMKPGSSRCPNWESTKAGTRRNFDRFSTPWFRISSTAERKSIFVLPRMFLGRQTSNLKCVEMSKNVFKFQMEGKSGSFLSWPLSKRPRIKFLETPVEMMLNKGKDSPLLSW